MPWPYYPPTAGEGEEPPPPPPPPGVLDTTITIANNSASASPSESFFVFGHPFKQGEVASDERLLITNNATGLPIPYQADLRRTWNDGSLKYASISVRLPSISGSGTFTLRLQSEEAAWDNTGLRSTSDFTSAHSFNIQATGISGLTGTWTANANDAVGAGGIWLRKIRTGPVCDEWLCIDKFNNGSDHGQLISKFYIRVWTTSTGSVGPIQLMPWVKQAYISGTAPSFLEYSALLRDGTTTIRNMSRSFTFTSADVNTSSETIAESGHNMARFQSGRFTTSGTLPGGLSAGITYYLRDPSSSTLTVHTSTANVASNSAVDLTSGGSGTHTFTTHIANQQRTGWFACDSDGKPEWITNGSFGEPDLYLNLTQTQKEYWVRTHAMPPLRWDLSPTATNQQFLYYPMTGHSLDYDRARNVVGPGGSPDRGHLPLVSARAFMAQSKVTADYDRAWALSYNSITEALFINPATNRIAVHNTNNTYTGLGTNLQSTYYFNSGDSSGVSIGTGSSQSWSIDHAHIPQYGFMPYLRDGEHWFLEIMHLKIARDQIRSRQNVSSSRSRTQTIAGTTYYTLIIHQQETRASGWSTRDVALGACLTPDGQGEKDYFNAMITDNINYLWAFLNDQLPSWLTLGFIGTNYGDHVGMDPQWQSGILLGAMGLLDLLAEPVATNKTNLFNTAKKLVRGYCGDPPAGLGSNHVFYAGVYEASLAIPLPQNSPSITTWDDRGTFVDGVFVSFSAATDVVTIGTSGWNSNFQNGDRVLFSSYGVEGATNNTEPPSPLVEYQWYFVRDKSSNTFKVASTSGGPAINITADASNVRMYLHGQGFSTGAIRGNEGDTFYAMQRFAAGVWREAGHTDITQSWLNIDNGTRWTGNEAANPHYAVKDPTI